MDTEAALRRAIQDHPHDETPRLVLADYLDDNGRSLEAGVHRIITHHSKPAVHHSNELSRHWDGPLAVRAWNSGATALYHLREAVENPYHLGMAVSDPRRVQNSVVKHLVAASLHHHDAARHHDEIVRTYPGAETDEHAHGAKLHKQAADAIDEIVSQHS